MSRRYYEEEMRYLHEAGKEFAQAHPAQARYLNIDSVADRDPYVERLFEGVAFLTGRIRQRLDDEIPQYTEGLFNLLYPHFLKPFPSCSILQFKPRSGLLQESIEIEKGVEVRSRPVGDERVTCRFTTTQTVRLHPMQLAEAKLDWDLDGKSSATLRFTLERGADFNALSLDPLRLYFHADPAIASIAHLFFTRHVERVTYRAGDATVNLGGQQWVQPGGLSLDEGLIPYSKYSFHGFRLLQEYFMFRLKFWFADLHGLDGLQPSEPPTEFEVQLFFDKAYPENKRFKTQDLRLYCTPIVNLFPQDAEPIRIQHMVSEYHVIPSVRYRNSIETYHIEKIISIEERTGKRWDYEPYFSFNYTDTSKRSFISTVREGPAGGQETYLTILGPSVIDSKQNVETLSLELTCTNAGVPQDRLQEGMITQPAPGIPSVADLENLTKPTLQYPPPIDEHPAFLWTLLSHLAFNHMTVASKEGLKGVVSLYEWTDQDANRKRIAGIRDAKWLPKEIIHRGGILRGAEVVIEIQDGHFSDEGDLCLFGLVLSEFFTLYATINSFVHVTLVQMPTGKRYEWHSKKGKQPII